MGQVLRLNLPHLHSRWYVLRLLGRKHMSTKISEMKLQAKEQHEVAFIVFAFHSTYSNSQYKSGLDTTI